MNRSRLLIASLAGAVVLAACQPAAPATPTSKPAEPAKPAASPAAPVASPAGSPAASPSVPVPAASPAASPVASPAAGGAPPPVVNIDAADFSFVAPDQIAGGLVTLRMRNVGQEAHHAQLLRLNDGITLEQLMAALAQGPVPALRLVSLEGGPAAVGPNGTAEVTLNLRPGAYIFACFIESPDGLPHLAKGMLKPLTVEAPPPVAYAQPTAVGTVTMRDFSFELPTLSAGRQVVRVTNEGPQQPHETFVVQLPTGRTLADVKAFYANPTAGPPPFQPVGGMQGLGIQGAGWATLELQPGSYAALCLIPDPSSGRAHLDLGMGTEFTVR